MNRCRSCHAYDKPENMLKIPLGYVCNSDCAIALSRDTSPRVKQQRAKLQSKRNKDDMRTLNLSDLSHQRKLTQKQCNKLVSLLDKWLPCISCGRAYDPEKRRNASHLKSVGSNSFLRYDLRNIHDACINCNLYNSGNIEGYKKGIVERYSQAHLDYIESAPRSRDWTIDELETMRAEFAAECRRIERGEAPSRNWRALN